MSAVITITLLFWSLRLIYNAICYVNLWWVKEYRLDRMRIHLKTNQGKQFLLIRFSGFHISPKTVILLVLSVLVGTYAYFLLPGPSLLRFLFIDLFLFPAVGVLVLLSNIPISFYHQVLIYLATQKLRAHKNLLVVGVTGSYGKTSTKEFLATILSQKFQVLKTEASKNSPIGIAEVVLRKLNSKHEIFVVEMGAYKKGEIKQMTQMVCPQVGIITAINEQHQDLFGSIVSTMHAKYELIEGLVGKNIAIMNADNMYVGEMMRWAAKDHKIVWAYTKSKSAKTQRASRSFYIENPTQVSGAVTFHVRMDGEDITVKAPVVGVHHVENITAAVAAAVACGMNFSDAAKASSNIRPVDRMMKPIRGPHGEMFIDDTFNNNPEAAIAAIDYLRATKGKKILVFQPMIELGEYAGSAHERVGMYAATHCDEIILTNTNYFDDFQHGVQKAQKNKTVTVMSPKGASEFIKKHVSDGDTILFKGKEAARVLALLQ